MEGGIEKRKRNREGGKEPEVMGSRAGGRRGSSPIWSLYANREII